MRSRFIYISGNTKFSFVEALDKFIIIAKRQIRNSSESSLSQNKLAFPRITRNRKNLLNVQGSWQEQASCFKSVTRRFNNVLIPIKLQIAFLKILHRNALLGKLYSRHLFLKAFLFSGVNSCAELAILLEGLRPERWFEPLACMGISTYYFWPCTSFHVLWCSIGYVRVINGIFSRVANMLRQAPRQMHLNLFYIYLSSQVKLLQLLGKLLKRGSTLILF